MNRELYRRVAESSLPPIDYDKVDDFTRDAVIRYCGRDPRVARRLTRTLCCLCDDYGEGSWSFAEFQELLENAAVDVSDEFRDSIRVVLSRETDCDGPDRVSLDVCVDCIETFEECMSAWRQAVDYVRHTQARERAQYEALKRKFEP